LLVFIDESGDAGMKNKQGSSGLFVMVAVIFKENQEAEKCDRRIADLRKTLSRSGQKEYQFNHTDRKERIEFFSVVERFDFTYVGFVLNKDELFGEGFKFKESFYKYTANLLFENAKGYLHEATVVIDRCGDREFRRQLALYLKKKVNKPGEKPAVKKFKMEASHNNNLIQLADMVVGALARSFKQEKEDSKVYRTILQGKERIVQFWPKPKK